MENKGNFIGIIENKKGVSLKLRPTPCKQIKCKGGFYIYKIINLF